METRPIAYQLYSARDEAAQNLGSVLQTVSRLGYDGVEFAGFYGHSAEAIVALMAEHGLIAISSHVPLQMIEDDMFGVISFHKKIGCPHIAIPYLDEQTRPGAPGFSRVLRRINQFGQLCEAAGIQLLYHNHDFEFLPISGQYGLDFLYDAVPARILQTEIDVCWVKYAGEDPAAYIRKYAGRCPIVHLKDYVGEKGGVSPYELIGQEDTVDRTKTAFEFRPVGYGCQDILSIVAASLESGAGWFVVEQDLSKGRAPLEAAAMSIETLRGIGVARQSK
ncbi:MAG: sugar phosphate isomerase/epimerase [Firmicutes bacterium]|nr:sugar phosphate isomerase/epimerase [Bacillota bacterium]